MMQKEKASKGFLGTKKGKGVLRGVCAAALLFILAAAGVRFLYVPAAPQAGDGDFFIGRGASMCFLGDSCTFAVLPLEAAADDQTMISDILLHARRFDVAVLPSCADGSVQMAYRFLGNCTVKTLLVPRGISSSDLSMLESAYPRTKILKMPFRKAVNFGQFQLYDMGTKKAMALSVTHGKEKLLFAVSPIGGTYDAAFISSGAYASSFTAPEVFTALEGDFTSPKIKSVGISPIKEVLSYVCDGQGNVARLTGR